MQWYYISQSILIISQPFLLRVEQNSIMFVLEHVRLLVMKIVSHVLNSKLFPYPKQIILSLKYDVSTFKYSNSKERVHECGERERTSDIPVCNYKFFQ